MSLDYNSKFNSDRKFSNYIKQAKNRKIMHGIYATVALLLLSVLLSLICSFEVLGWIISISFSIIVSVLVLLIYVLPDAKAFTGIVIKIDHDYRLDVRKGTAGLPRNHSPIRQNHSLLVSIECETKSDVTKIKQISLNAQYEKVLSTDSRILIHPALPYPAVLSKGVKCICMLCGTMQDSNRKKCYNCDATLYNFTTENESYEK